MILLDTNVLIYASTAHSPLPGVVPAHKIESGAAHYANEMERQRWIEEWPDEILPEREDPPRDRLLPQAELREKSPVM